MLISGSNIAGGNCNYPEFYTSLDDWKQSTVGTGARKKDIVKTTIRNSKMTTTREFGIYSDIDECVKSSVPEQYKTNSVNISDVWTILKYEKGDFFKKHKDGVSQKEHVSTILAIPPKSICEHSGGELVIYKDDNTGDIECEIHADQNEWTIVCMNVNISHEVKPVLSGIRYVFKNKIIVNTECVISDEVLTTV